MSDNTSANFYLRFLNERFALFKSALEAFLRDITRENDTRKLEAADSVLQALDDLRRSLSSQDHPAWFGVLQERLSWYKQNQKRTHDSGLEVLKTVLQLHSHIEKQQWAFVTTNSAEPVDFSAIYKEYFNSSRIPDLFDELVSQLQSIIDGGLVDSVKITKALERLIATIRKNAKGDYFSTRGTWEFTRVLFRNLFIEHLKAIPILKPTIEAIAKTMTELDIEMRDLSQKIENKVLQSFDSVTEQLPLLAYQQMCLPSDLDEDQLLNLGPNSVEK